MGYIPYVECEILFTDEFEEWWIRLSMDEQDAVDRVVRLLEAAGATLTFPYSSGIATSQHSHMRELRIQHDGHPYRVLYAFDPNRRAVLLIGGVKTGDDRWYRTWVPVADRIYREYLQQMENG
jgi:hypothetical protein